VIAIDGPADPGAVRDHCSGHADDGPHPIAFDADNPGRWAFHCHNLYHLITGMLTEFRYGGLPLTICFSKCSFTPRADERISIEYPRAAP